MRYDLALFDLDGTLIDSLPDIAATANRTLAAFGLPPLEAEVVRGFVGFGVRHLVEGCFAGRTSDLDRAERTFRSFYIEQPCVHTKVYPGVHETLKGLGVSSLAVVTNKPQKVAEAVLVALDLARYFFVVLGGDALDARKPDPGPVLEVLRRVAASPDRSILVGDGEADLTAGRAAGVSVCLARYGYLTAAQLAELQPDFFIDRFEELVSIARGERRPRRLDSAR